MEGSDRIRRLRWLCRRGMKELDILLERFVSDRSLDLEAGEWPEFEALLAEEDDLLWDLLQDPGTHGGEAYRALLAEIREYHA